jgi:5-hydroxyisourate hydrolase-like protein (transthyretin family)
MSSYQQVDVFVLNKTTGAPFPGVMVRVYDEEGKVFYSDAQTDADGKAGFLLWTRTYTLRFYKFQVRFSQPQIIEVLEGEGGTPVQNAFNAYAETVDSDPSPDPLLCRASGYFRDITGAPHRYLDIIFIGQFAPILLDGSGVLSERRMIRTDKSGRACVDLIRCAMYSATVQGYEDQVRKIYVPDAPSVSLPELLFPMAASVSFDLPSPWTLSVGSTQALVPSILTSTGIPLSGVANADVMYETEDPSIATVQVLDGTTLQLTPISSGSTKLLVKRRDTSVINIPFTSELDGSGAAIVVS